MTTTFVTIKSNGSFGVERDESLKTKGYVWAPDKYRSFETNGDYYRGYEKSGESLILIVRLKNGIIGYNLAEPNEWAMRTGRAYGSAFN